MRRSSACSRRSRCREGPRAMTSGTAVLAPETLAAVRRLEIRSRRALRSGLTGKWRGAWRGGGLEFAEVREYVAGDDVRAVDWNVTARRGRMHVKRFEE